MNHLGSKVSSLTLHWAKSVNNLTAGEVRNCKCTWMKGVTHSSQLCKPKSLLGEDFNFWNYKFQDNDEPFGLIFKSCAARLNITAQGVFYAVFEIVIIMIIIQSSESNFWLDKSDINHLQVSCIKIKLHQCVSQKKIWEARKRTNCERKNRLYVLKYRQIRADIPIPPWTWKTIDTLLKN